MLVAHLACRSITLDDSSFCPSCGKKLSEKNTIPVNMDNPAVTEEIVEYLLANNHSFGSYDDINEIK